MSVATTKTPALVIYLLDVSGSMNENLGTSRKIDLLNAALKRQVVKMVQRSTKGTAIADRYAVAMFAYSNYPEDVLDGVQYISELAQIGVPTLVTKELTGTAEAFAAAENLLRSELPNYQHCPPPLVCHMTDGQFTSSDPEPIADRIKQMSVTAGKVLVENVFITNQALTSPIDDAKSWPGLTSEDELQDNYAKLLFRMSSTLPEDYQKAMKEMGYNIAPGAKLMLPGNDPDLIELAFQISGVTGLVDVPSTGERYEVTPTEEEEEEENHNEEDLD